MAMRLQSRHGLGALVLASLVGWNALPAPEPRPSQGCSSWVGIHSQAGLRLSCGAETVLTLCPPTASVRAGALLTPVFPKNAPCITQVAQLSARIRLSLGQRLDVNTASSNQLQLISGIGPAMARRILATRPFIDLADLERVRGIGPTRRLIFERRLRVEQASLLWPVSLLPDASTLQKPSNFQAKSVD